MRSILVNGLPLLLGHVGQGVYTARLVQLLKGILPEDRLRVLLPTGAECPFDLNERLVLRFPPGPAVGPGLFRQLIVAWSLSRFVQRHDAEAIFLSPGPFPATLPPRSIVILHDVIYRHFPRYEGRFFLRKAINRLAERVARTADRVVTISEFSRTEIETLAGVPKEKIRVIPNWVDDGFFERLTQPALAGFRARYGLPERYWLYVGGYDYRKNVAFLLEAYADAAAQTPCPPLVLAGRIPTDLRKPVCRVHETIARLGLSGSQVILPGFIPDADLPALYQAAALFVFPSLMEGFGFTPAEAIASGCPALVADNSALREVVPDPNYRFQTYDISALSTHLTMAATRGLPENPTPSDFSARDAARLYQELLGSLPPSQ